MHCDMTAIGWQQTNNLDKTQQQQTTPKKHQQKHVFQINSITDDFRNSSATTGDSAPIDDSH